MSVKGLTVLKGTKIISCFTCSLIILLNRIQSNKSFDLSIRRPGTASTGIVIARMGDSCSRYLKSTILQSEKKSIETKVSYQSKDIKINVRPSSPRL